MAIKQKNKKDFLKIRAPQLRSLINCTNILEIQYNTSKTIMASINKNSQTTKNHYIWKTHINNIIFSNMKILQHKPWVIKIKTNKLAKIERKTNNNVNEITLVFSNVTFFLLNISAYFNKWPSFNSPLMIHCIALSHKIFSS